MVWQLGYHGLVVRSVVEWRLRFLRRVHRNQSRDSQFNLSVPSYEKPFQKLQWRYEFISFRKLSASLNFDFANTWMRWRTLYLRWKFIFLCDIGRTFLQNVPADCYRGRTGRDGPWCSGVITSYFSCGQPSRWDQWTFWPNLLRKRLVSQQNILNPASVDLLFLVLFSWIVSYDSYFRYFKKRIECFKSPIDLSIYHLSIYQ